MARQTEQREAERFPVNGDTICPLTSPVVEDFGPVRVRDVSMAGVGLILSRRVEVGTLLAVTLSNAAKGVTRTVLVRVTHSTPLGGSFLVGGSFNVPLTYQEMSAFVM